MAIGCPHLFHVEHGEHDAFRIAERERCSGIQAVRALLGHVQDDGDRPERAVRKSHLLADARVVGARHESGQRREPPVREKLEVADLTGRQIPGGPLPRGAPELFGPRVGNEQVDEHSTVRFDQMVTHAHPPDRVRVRDRRDPNETSVSARLPGLGPARAGGPGDAETAAL
jgi:hypothetical protein